MRIVRLVHRPHAGPIRRAGNARQRWHERRSWLVTLEDDAGRRGIGEASPLPGFGTDDLAAADRDLGRWQRRLPVEVDADLEGGPLELGAPGLDELTSAAARCALETALLDLVGQRSGRPLWSLLGAEEPRPVPVAGLIHTEDPGEATRQARHLIDRGITRAKLKIGRPGRLVAELEVAEAVRAAGISELRLDANAHLPQAALADDLARLAAFGPALVEEPAAAEALLEMTLPEVPLAVDETLLCRDAEALVERLSATGRLAAVVLKPMALGGVLPALAWAERAAGHGIGAIASHLFDGPIAWHAAAHLALSLPGPPWAAGLDRHGGLDAWPARSLPLFDHNRIVASDRPGLGFDARGTR